MRRILQAMIPATMMALAVAAQAGVTTDKSEPPRRLASFEMTRPAQSAESVAARVNAAVEAIIGEKLGRPVAVPAIGAQPARRLDLHAPDAPGLRILYLPDFDELRIVDTEISAATSPRNEMEPEQALAVAKKTFEELARRKLVNGDDYSWERADIASTWVGGGSADGKIAEKRMRVEYRVTLRRQLNGIEVANAGIRIAVHASGRVSSLRFGGVTIAAKRGATGLEPTGRGRWLERKASIPELDARFEREVVPRQAAAKVAWARVMYVMPENERSAVVEPLYVVSYSLHVPSDEGQVAISRRKTVGFSLVDPNAKPIDLTPPNRTHEVDRETKKAPPS